MTNRNPNAKTFDLGHFEAMQICLAIGLARAAVADPKDLPVEFELLDGDVLAEIEPMFQSGNVSVTNRPVDEDDESLGPCGCTDYHMADCPTRTGGSDGDLIESMFDDDRFM